MLTSDVKVMLSMSAATSWVQQTRENELVINGLEVAYGCSIIYISNMEETSEHDTISSSTQQNAYRSQIFAPLKKKVLGKIRIPSRTGIARVCLRMPCASSKALILASFSCKHGTKGKEGSPAR